MPGTDAYDEPIKYKDEMLSINVWQVVKTYKHQAWNKRWHYHKEIELLYMQEGSMEIRVQDELYRLHAGNVLVIGSCQPHVTRKVDEHRLAYLVLHFDIRQYLDAAALLHYRFFAELDRPLSVLNPVIHAGPALQAELARSITAIHEEMQAMDKAFKMAASLHVKHILLKLFRSDPRDAIHEHDPMATAALYAAIDYVQSRLSTKIDMKEVSEKVNMNYYYFSKFFKKKMGVSFVEYVNLQKIKKAQQLLLTEDSSMTEIAEKVGIHNMAHFYSLFRRYNQCSPKAYVRRVSPPPSSDREPST